MKNDTNRPFELESGAIRMAQDMQAMKDKVDMMISVMSGQMATNLDNLVHCTNFPFMVKSHLVSYHPNFECLR